MSQFGIDVGVLLGGAIITEQVFGMPGLGWTAVNAIETQDLPVVIGIVIVACTAAVVRQHPGRRGLRRARPSGAPALAPLVLVAACPDAGSRRGSPTVAEQSSRASSGLVSEP